MVRQLRREHSRRLRCTKQAGLLLLMTFDSRALPVQCGAPLIRSQLNKQFERSPGCSPGPHINQAFEFDASWCVTWPRFPAEPQCPALRTRMPTLRVSEMNLWSVVKRV